jgi:hypothetical protein
MGTTGANDMKPHFRRSSCNNIIIPPGISETRNFGEKLSSSESFIATGGDFSRPGVESCEVEMISVFRKLVNFDSIHLRKCQVAILLSLSHIHTGKFRFYYSCLQKGWPRGGWRLLRLIWENENKQNTTDPKLGFALDRALSIGYGSTKCQ